MSNICNFKALSDGQHRGTGCMVLPSGEQVVLFWLDQPIGADTIRGINHFRDRLHALDRSTTYSLAALQSMATQGAGLDPDSLHLALGNAEGAKTGFQTCGSFHFFRLSTAAPPHLASSHTTFDIDNSGSFLAVTGSIDRNALSTSSLRAGKLAMGAIKDELDKAAGGSAWAAALFPIDQTLDLSSPDWPWNPLIGPMEERYHERWGIRRIVDSLFANPRFADGQAGEFKLVPAPAAIGVNSSREFDGLLISSFGTCLLELKDHQGKITVDATASTGGRSLKVGDGTQGSSDPLGNLRAGVRRLQSHPALIQMERPEARRLTALVFTHPKADVTVIDPNGAARPLPCQIGEVLVCQPDQLAAGILQYARQILGKRLKERALSPTQIHEVCENLLAQGGAIRTADTKARIELGSGIEVFLDQEVVSESTAYFKAYRANYSGDECLAKRFDLSPLSISTRAMEEERLAREVKVLNRLIRHRPLIGRITSSYEDFRIDDALYVLVDTPPEQSLEDWTRQDRQLAERLTLMRELAVTLEEIVVKDASLVHRAINPGNVRIDDAGQPVLINFERCYSDQIATIAAAARQSTDTQFLAPEAMSPGNQVSPATDVYSFMLCLHFVLLGKRLSYENISRMQRPRGRRPAPGFGELIAQMGLPPTAGEVWKRALHHTPDYRPDIAEIGQHLEEWIKA